MAAWPTPGRLLSVSSSHRPAAWRQHAMHSSQTQARTSACLPRKLDDPLGVVGWLLSTEPAAHTRHAQPTHRRRWRLGTAHAMRLQHSTQRQGAGLPQHWPAGGSRRGLTCTCASPELLPQQGVFLPQQLNLPSQQGDLGLPGVVLHHGPVVDVLGARGVAQRAERLLNLRERTYVRRRSTRPAWAPDMPWPA
jgi:hypothetical protein